MVAINKGSEDGIEAGHVLSLLTKGARIKDTTDKSKAMIKLPSESNGTAMVFRTFDRVSDALLLEIHKNNFAQIAPGTPFAELPHRGSSTDMGDISSIMPALHPYSGGAAGTPHEDDFVITDPEAAYITSAKLLALDTIDLLWGDGCDAPALAADKPLLTRDAYRRRFD